MDHLIPFFSLCLVSSFLLSFFGWQQMPRNIRKWFHWVQWHWHRSRKKSKPKNWPIKWISVTKFCPSKDMEEIFRSFATQMQSNSKLEYLWLKKKANARMWIEQTKFDTKLHIREEHSHSSINLNTQFC